MFSAFLALAFSIVVCVGLTVGFGTMVEQVRDAYERARVQLTGAVDRALRRRTTQQG